MRGEAQESPWGQAHGKLILIGEHAVIYGVPGMAIPVPLSVQVRLDRGKPLPQLPEPWCQWFRALALRYSSTPLLPVESKGDLPQGAGLGSSAAFTVASLRALQRVSRLGEEELLPLADEGEKIFHGNPSGLDVRTVLSSSGVRFQRRGGGELCTEPLPAPGRPFYLTLWITPAGPSTREMVARVKAALVAQGEEELLRRAEEIVEAAYRAYIQGDLSALGEAVRAYHQWLKGVGASTPLLDELVEGAMEKGSPGAKLSGAGGGGVVMALWEEPPPPFPLPPGVQEYRFPLLKERSQPS